MPAQIEAVGITIVVIADQMGAPTLESVVAGPLPVTESPVVLAEALYGGGS